MESETIQKIISNYQHLEHSLVQQLQLEVHGHHLTTGTYREEVWKSLFEQIIPKKFCIKQGVFIIDSKGHISREVDLAIFDEQYTPYIFNYGKIKFIPIEAVAVVVQCKSTRLDEEDLSEWAGSINKLKTSLNSFARVMGQVINNNEKDSFASKAQSATRPVKILCCTAKSINKKIAELFDISLHLAKGGNSLFKIMPEENRTYDCWYKELNHYKSGSDIDVKPTPKRLSDLRITDDEENVLLSLIFQLNQMLMIINNPMFFPHQSYVEMFRKCITGQLTLEKG
jgi:hypothetical protein